MKNENGPPKKGYYHKKESSFLPKAIILTHHTMNFGSEMLEVRHVVGKNIFWSSLAAESKEKGRGGFEIHTFPPFAFKGGGGG